jgi:integrase
MARRQTNIRRRGKSWVVHHRANGKQHWQSFKTREEAELELSKVLARKARGESQPQQTKVRFNEFAAQWLRVYAASKVGPRTFEGYEGVLRVHLVPEFGERHLGDISALSIEEFMSDWIAGGPRFQERVELARSQEQRQGKEEGRKPRPIRLGRSPKTVANALVVLKEMFKHAIKWNYLSTNPASEIKRPRVERNVDDMHVLTPDEIGRLLKAASPEGWTLLLCAVTTGARRGELLGLKWGDLDQERRRIKIRRSVGSDGRFQQPKTRGSVREIAVGETVIRALRAHRLASPRKELDDLIFPSERGTPLDGNNMVRRFLTPALRRARLPHIRFHDTPSRAC